MTEQVPALAESSPDLPTLAASLDGFKPTYPHKGLVLAFKVDISVGTQLNNRGFEIDPTLRHELSRFFCFAAGGETVSS